MKLFLNILVVIGGLAAFQIAVWAGFLCCSMGYVGCLFQAARVMSD